MEENIPRCVVCGKELVGGQKRFCNMECMEGQNVPGPIDILIGTSQIRRGWSPETETARRVCQPVEFLEVPICRVRFDE